MATDFDSRTLMIPGPRRAMIASQCPGRAELEKAALKKLSGAEERHGALVDFEITLAANASEEGKLYGSIGPREIADAVTKKGLTVEKSEVIMGEGPIRYTGEHMVLIHLHADVEAEIKVTINPE